MEDPLTSIKQSQIREFPIYTFLFFLKKTQQTNIRRTCLLSPTPCGSPALPFPEVAKAALSSQTFLKVAQLLLRVGNICQSGWVWKRESKCSEVLGTTGERKVGGREGGWVNECLLRLSGHGSSRRAVQFWGRLPSQKAGCRVAKRAEMGGGLCGHKGKWDAKCLTSDHVTWRCCNCCNLGHRS